MTTLQTLPGIDPKYYYKATILSIHDGDTLRMDIDLGFTIHFLTPSARSPMSFRIYGYDAPELGRNDFLGEEARDKAIEWTVQHGKAVNIHTVKDIGDKYGRYLVDQIYDSQGNDLIRHLVDLGYLKPYLGVGPKPTWP